MKYGCMNEVRMYVYKGTFLLSLFIFVRGKNIVGSNFYNPCPIIHAVHYFERYICEGEGETDK